MTRLRLILARLVAAIPGKQRREPGIEVVSYLIPRTQQWIDDNVVTIPDELDPRS